MSDHKEQMITLTEADIDLIIWALGFVEGRMSEAKCYPPGGARWHIDRMHEIWPKLADLKGMMSK